MALYAFLDNNNTVVDVKEGESAGFIDWEQYYATARGLSCKRTEPHMFAGRNLQGGPEFRKNTAIIGYSFDPNLNAFIPPQKYSDWTLNTETCVWEPPIPAPNDGNIYIWSNSNSGWVILQGELSA